MARHSFPVVKREVVVVAEMHSREKEGSRGNQLAVAAV